MTKVAAHPGDQTLDETFADLWDNAPWPPGMPKSDVARMVFRMMFILGADCAFSRCFIMETDLAALHKMQALAPKEAAEVEASIRGELERGGKVAVVTLNPEAAVTLARELTELRGQSQSLGLATEGNA